MTFDTHTIEPASSRALAEFVSAPPWIRSSMSSPVDQSAASTSTDTEDREQPSRAVPHRVRQQEREDHRDEDGSGHGPTRLADDRATFVSAHPRPFSTVSGS